MYLGFMETLTHAPVLARFSYAVSDPTRARILLTLTTEPAYPSDLADSLGVSRQSMYSHLTCLRGCGLVVAVPDGRRSRYELAHARLGHAIGDLIGVVLAVDPYWPWTRPAAHPTASALYDGRPAHTEPGPAEQF